MIDLKKVYQNIYTTDFKYGNADLGKSPGVNLLPLYADYLIPHVIDVGCGRGQLVNQLRNQDIKCEGIDFIDLNNGMMVGDITEDINMDNYNTSICIDVIEHIEPDKTEALLSNLMKTNVQIIAIHNGPSVAHPGLHINIRPFKEWTDILSTLFNIEETHVIKEHKRLYICHRK